MPKPEPLTSVAQWAEKEEPRNLTMAAAVRQNRKAESDNVRESRISRFLKMPLVGFRRICDNIAEPHDGLLITR